MSFVPGAFRRRLLHFDDRQLMPLRGPKGAKKVAEMMARALGGRVYSRSFPRGGPGSAGFVNYSACTRPGAGVRHGRCDPGAGADFGDLPPRGPWSIVPGALVSASQRARFKFMLTRLPHRSAKGHAEGPAPMRQASRGRSRCEYPSC